MYVSLSHYKGYYNSQVIKKKHYYHTYVIKKELFKMAHKFNMLISNMPYWKGIKKPAADEVPGTVNGNGYIRNGFRNGIRRIKEAITKD